MEMGVGRGVKKKARSSKAFLRANYIGMDALHNLTDMLSIGRKGRRQSGRSLTKG
jgi:hypothetical protein